MPGGYSNVVVKRLNTFQTSSKTIKTYFCYPNVALISELGIIKVANVEVHEDPKSVENPDKLVNYDFKHHLIDTALQDSFLWVSTGQLFVLDLLQGIQMKVTLTDYTNYSIREIRYIRGVIYFITESEEWLVTSCSVKELSEHFNSGITEIEIPAEKFRGSRQEFMNKWPKVTVGGIELYIYQGVVTVECPLTSQKVIMPSPTHSELKSIMNWDQFIILSDESNMWALDLNNVKIALEYKTDGIQYYPLGTYGNEFYYVCINGSKAEVYSIMSDSFLSTDQNVDEGYHNNTLKKADSQDMLKSQVRLLIDNVLAGTTDFENIYKEFVLLFKKITDIVFLIDSGSKLCQSSIAYKSLLYIIQAKLTEPNDDHKLIKELCSLIFKVDIIEYINFKGNTCYKDINIFEHHFKQLCNIFIANSDFDLASLCWLKYSELRESLCSDDILSILNAIPINTKMGALIIWFKNFAPILLEDNPYHLDLFVRWITERVFSLENSTYWPKIGLKFIDEIITVLESSLKTISVRPISMDDLDVLKVRITYIMELKNNYKINLSLAELSSQNPTEVILIMLHRCYTEDLELFLNYYLPTYAIRHNFELDDTLRSYIESVAATGGGSIDCTRLSILLNTFRIPSNKLDCLLGVLRYLDVPWDKNIYDLAVNAAIITMSNFTSNETDRKLAKEIEEELTYANLKVILKKYNYPLGHTDYIEVIHKIVNSPLVDIEDLKIVMNVSAVYKKYGSLLYVDRCLLDCNTKLALIYISSLSEKESRIVLKSVLSKYEHIIDNRSSNKAVERCYIDFFKGAQLLQEFEIITIERMYHLKNSGNNICSMNDMYCEYPHHRELINLRPDDVSHVELTKGVSILSRTSHWRNSTLVGLMQKIYTNRKVRKLFESLLEALEYISCEKIASILSDCMDGTNNSSFLLECCRVLVQLISGCAEEHIYHLMKVLFLLNAMINTGIAMRNLSSAWIFHYVYMPITSFRSEDDLLLFYSKPVGEEGIENDYLMKLCNRNDFLPFRIFANILSNYYVTAMDDVFDHFKEKLVKRVITKIAITQDPDELYLSSLLFMINTDSDDLGTFILDTLKGTNETLPPSLTSYLASPAIQSIFGGNILPTNTASFSPQYILKSKYNMTLADIALPDITEETWDVKLVLFYVLKQQPHLCLDQVIDLCLTLNVAVDDGLSLQVIAKLTTWELKYKMYNDKLGRQKIYIENDKIYLLQQCVGLWESIKNKEFLKDILNDFWKNGEVSLHGRLISINPYLYEVYLCIYYMIFKTNSEIRQSKEYFILNFLKDYKRRSPPQQYEFELFSVKGMFPEIGHYRLPFHLFMRDDMWLNLKSEITLETYEQWLPAVALLSLDKDLQTAKDMICSNALKQTMKTRNVITTDTDPKETEPWRLWTREEPLLRSAHRCVRHIANMEWAGACLFYVLQGCGRGADQVAAAQLCYHFAQRWDALQPGNRAVRKMERLHSTLSTRHALHKIDWSTDELVQLVTEPTQLIRAMYLHPNFVEKMTRYDVNNATNEIADKNGINISSIRIQILENILDKNDDCGNKNNFGLQNRELMTAKYILKATCPKMGAIYLSRITFDDEIDFNKLKKLRALQCLMSIVEPETSLKVTNRHREALWKSLLELYYVLHLEQIEMPWAIGAFMQDKTRALDQILAANGTNIEGLKLAAELAHLYGDMQTVTKVIKLLLRASLYDEMIPLLLRVLTPPDDMIRSAWRAVLLFPFKSADYPITERQKNNCIKSINLLPLCPVIRDEDLKEIWKNCVRCKCFGIGSLVLPYMTNETRQSLNELRKIDRRNLIASLKNLHTETYLVSGAMFVIENSMSKNNYR